MKPAGAANRPVLFAALAFLIMEPLAYLAHRFVMHKVGWVLHRSHHARRTAALEANDVFPAVFASLAVLVLSTGSRHRSLSRLGSVVAGVAAYGAAYAFVHDAYIHARFGRLPRVHPLDYLMEAHRLHHSFGGEPYGMLFPIVPKTVREKVEPIGQRVG